MSTRKKEKVLLFREQQEKMGARLVQLRKKLGYTSAEKFANDKGFSRPTYGKWEQGNEELNLELKTLVKLANAYGVTLKEFFSEGFD